MEKIVGQAKQRGSLAERIKLAEANIVNLYSNEKYEELLKDSTNLKVPRIIDDKVKNFCNKISKIAPLYLKVTPEPKSTLDNCDINVRDKIQRDGGTLVAGYKIWYLEDAYIMAERHAVWKNNKNELHEISFDLERNKEILFLPDTENCTVLEDKIPRIDMAYIKNLESTAEYCNIDSHFFWENQKKQSEGLVEVAQTENYVDFSKRVSPISDVMHLSDILPLESIQQALGEQYDYKIKHIRDLDSILQNSELKGAFYENCASGWHNHCVRNQLPEEQRRIGESFNADNKILYKQIERRIGALIFDDLIAMKVFINENPTPVAELFLSTTFNGALKIHDVCFQNIFKPKEKYTLQKYEGLNAFSQLILNAKLYCSQHGINQISLTAANIDLIPFFESHGFVVEDSEVARKGISVFKAGIPMHLYL